jgi:hypothetical protein
MAKLSRSALKSVVKECLVEILNEGILSEGGSSRSMISESRVSRPPRASSPSLNGSSRSLGNGGSSRRRPGLDAVSYGLNPDKPINEKFEKNVDNAVRNLTSDPVLSSIFQDTARTTLQEQRTGSETGSGPVSHETAVLTQGDTAAKAAASSDPMEMFAGAADRWASLAFESSPRK